MNLDYLNYFITLAHTENYTIASEELYISQPSLSYAISSLETELGVKLFEKKGRNVVLSNAGNVFLGEISGGLESLKTALNKMESIKNGSGYISIGSLRILTQSYIPNILKDFSNLYNHKDINIKLDTSTGMSLDILKGVKDKIYDVGFCSYLENQKNLEFVKIHKQKMVLIVPVNHELAKFNSILPYEIEDYPFIGYKERSGLRKIVYSMLNDNDVNPNIMYEVSEDETASGMVEAGFGISIVPHMHILDHLDIKIIDIKNIDLHRYYYMAYLKNTPHLPVVENFINYVISNYALTS